MATLQMSTVSKSICRTSGSSGMKNMSVNSSQPTHFHVCVKLGKLNMYTKRQGTRCTASICQVCHSAALLLTVVSETSWPSMHLRFSVIVWLRGCTYFSEAQRRQTSMEEPRLLPRFSTSTLDLLQPIFHTAS